MEIQLSINGLGVVGEGNNQTAQELIGLALDPNSFLFANRLIVGRSPEKALLTYGFFMKPWLNSGNPGIVNWDFKRISLFLYGKREACPKRFKFCQWNFE